MIKAQVVDQGQSNSATHVGENSIAAPNLGHGLMEQLEPDPPNNLENSMEIHAQITSAALEQLTSALNGWETMQS